MSTIAAEHLASALRAILRETFEEVQGIYLDRQTSLLETLAGISAAEASIPVGGKCATLAAQVKHTAFYLDVLEQSARSGTFEPVDWHEIWRTVRAVTPEEWAGLQAELRASYQRVLALIDDTPEWKDANMIGGAIATIVHSAYHLGEIRQALCILRADQ